MVFAALLQMLLVCNCFIKWRAMLAVSSHQHRRHTSGFESTGSADPLICDLCQAKFNTREAFKDHLQAKHNIPTGPQVK
jgi:hypothetical protein